MTRTKKKSYSPEPSVVQAAWDAFYRESAVEDLEAKQAEGWKTFEQIVEETGRSRSSIDSAIRKSDKFERYSARFAAPDGTIRKMNLVRPKLKG